MQGINQPSSAWKARSRLYPLAVKTAFTTDASMDGNASFSCSSACCRGLSGRGGFGGAGASSALGVSALEVVVVVVVSGLEGAERMPVS